MPAAAIDSPHHIGQVAGAFGGALLPPAAILDPALDSFRETKAHDPRWTPGNNREVRNVPRNNRPRGDHGADPDLGTPWGNDCICSYPGVMANVKLAVRDCVFLDPTKSAVEEKRMGREPI